MTFFFFACVCVRAFVGKVEKAQASISFALKVHTAAIPEDLNGHLVLVGSHPRLQHYVLAIRRQRPHVPLVMVTKDEVSKNMESSIVSFIFHFLFDSAPISVLRPVAPRWCSW